MLDVMKRRKLSVEPSSTSLHQPPSHHHHHHHQSHHHDLQAQHQHQLYDDASAVSSYASLQQQLHQQQLSRRQSQEHQHHTRRLFAAHYVGAQGDIHVQRQQLLFSQGVPSSTELGSATPTAPLGFVTNGAVCSPVVRATAAPRTESPQSLPGISSMLRRPTASVAAPVIASAGRVVVPGANASMMPPRPRSESVGSGVGNASGRMVAPPAEIIYTGASSARQLPSSTLPERWSPETTSISPVKSVSPLRLAPPLAATSGTFFLTSSTSHHHRHPDHIQHQYPTRGKRPAPTPVPAIDLTRVRSPSLSLRHSISSLDDLKSFSSGPSSTTSTPRGGDDLAQLSNGFVTAVTGAVDYIDSDSALTAASSRTTSAVGEERIANPNKNSRYLREMDRREILSRIEQGEKQATLAKEYQVSRAAICNLNKHRDEVMSRKDENPLAKHPKKPRPKTFKIKIRASKSKKLPSPGGARASSGAGGSGGGKAATIHEVKSRAAALLLTSVRNKNTSIGEFRRCSERLLRLVLEDALALVPIKAVEVFLSDLVKADGVSWEHPPCAISMEQRQTCGSPLLDLFRAVEPDQPSARVSMGGVDNCGADSLMLPMSICTELTDAATLPLSLKYHNVFVFDISATSSDAICSVIQRLQECGAVEAMISIVVLFITSDVIAAMRSRYPCVKVVAAQIDPSGKRPPSPTVVAGVDCDGGRRTLQSFDAEPQPPPCCLDFVVDRFRQVYA